MTSLCNVASRTSIGNESHGLVRLYNNSQKSVCVVCDKNIQSSTSNSDNIADDNTTLDWQHLVPSLYRLPRNGLTYYILTTIIYLHSGTCATGNTLILCQAPIKSVFAIVRYVECIVSYFLPRVCIQAKIITLHGFFVP